MASSRFAFSALLKKVNPDSSRAEVAQRLPGQVRDWLKEHDYQTVAPHSRLIGSYGRQTAIKDIKDVDTLLFLPEAALERTPEAVLRELKGVLDDYPDATAEAAPQRRSIRLDFTAHELRMDIVGAVAKDGTDKPLWVPDRQKKEWIRSDPLGYGKSLSDANADHGDKLVPLVKLAKGWRDVHMVTRRPKSYLLEVIVYQAVVNGHVALSGKSTAENVCDLFEHLAAKWKDLMDEENGVPRVLDPQLGFVLSTGWDRSHFETFMRRVREAAAAGRKAVDADSDEDAYPHWARVFGDLWPTKEEVKEEARSAEPATGPGKSYVSRTGEISSTVAAGSFLTRATTFHGPISR